MTLIEELAEELHFAELEFVRYEDDPNVHPDKLEFAKACVKDARLGIKRYYEKADADKK